jgi:putative FmdB family regulatory protein
MPVYTYQCESCGVRFDRYQKFTEQSLAWCPECGKKALRKVYSPVGIVFKGSGFYATDNKSPSGVSYANDKKNGEKPEDNAKAASESKPAGASSTTGGTEPAKPPAADPKD